jgi:hypothetical protein
MFFVRHMNIDTIYIILCQQNSASTRWDWSTAYCIKSIHHFLTMKITWCRIWQLHDKDITTSTCKQEVSALWNSTGNTFFHISNFHPLFFLFLYPFCTLISSFPPCQFAAVDVIPLSLRRHTAICVNMWKLHVSMETAWDRYNITVNFNNSISNSRLYRPKLVDS